MSLTCECCQLKDSSLIFTVSGRTPEHMTLGARVHLKIGLRKKASGNRRSWSCMQSTAVASSLASTPLWTDLTTHRNTSGNYWFGTSKCWLSVKAASRRSSAWRSSSSRSKEVAKVHLYSCRPQASPLLDALYWVGPVPYLELLRLNQSFLFIGWDQFHT